MVQSQFGVPKLDSGCSKMPIFLKWNKFRIISDIIDMTSNFSSEIPQSVGRHNHLDYGIDKEA